MDGVDNYSPHAESIGIVNADGAVRWIGGMKLYITVWPMSQIQALYCELPVNIGYNDITVIWIQTAVYYSYIPFNNAGIAHGVTINAGIESGFTMMDHILVKVQSIMQVVLRGTRKAGTDTGS